jgi:hypothetical protein
LSRGSGFGDSRTGAAHGFARRLPAVYFQHGEIEEDYIRIDLWPHFDSLSPVCCRVPDRIGVVTNY